jgi:hypothetical protein
MNRVFKIALVLCLILFILAIFISPVLDLLPSALRVQQWLCLIAAMFSLAALLSVCILKIRTPDIGSPDRDEQCLQRTCLADLDCCLRC